MKTVLAEKKEKNKARINNTKGSSLKIISAIVPIFNEEKTVAKVVQTLLESSLINEVVCVNDGSADKSLSILKNFGNKITLINFKKNQGKGFVLAEGVKRAKGEIVVFIDADLVNFSENHIESLLGPILRSKARAVLGYPSRAWRPFNIFSNLTGERAYYKKDLIPYLERMAKARFGVEVFLNDVFKKSETQKIPLKELKGLYKYEKRNSAKAFKEYLDEAIEITREIGRQEGLPLEDFQVIARISKVSSFKELNIKIREITNKKFRHFLEKHILNYIKIFRRWWD